MVAARTPRAGPRPSPPAPADRGRHAPAAASRASSSGPLQVGRGVARGREASRRPFRRRCADAVRPDLAGSRYEDTPGCLRSRGGDLGASSAGRVRGALGAPPRGSDVRRATCAPAAVRAVRTFAPRPPPRPALLGRAALVRATYGEGDALGAGDADGAGEADGAAEAEGAGDALGAAEADGAADADGPALGAADSLGVAEPDGAAVAEGAGVADWIGVAEGSGVGVGSGENSPPCPRRRALAKISTKTTTIPMTKACEIRSSMWTARSEIVGARSGASGPRRAGFRALPAVAAPALPAFAAPAVAVVAAPAPTSASCPASSSSPSAASSPASAASRSVSSASASAASASVCLLGRAPVGLGHRCVVTPWCRGIGGEHTGPSSAARTLRPGSVTEARGALPRAGGRPGASHPASASRAGAHGPQWRLARRGAETAPSARPRRKQRPCRPAAQNGALPQRVETAPCPYASRSGRLSEPGQPGQHRHDPEDDEDERRPERPRQGCRRRPSPRVIEPNTAEKRKEITRPIMSSGVRSMNSVWVGMTKTMFAAPMPSARPSATPTFPVSARPVDAGAVDDVPDDDRAAAGDAAADQPDREASDQVADPDRCLDEAVAGRRRRSIGD